MRSIGSVGSAVVACVAISVAAVSFVWGDDENGRNYNVMGRDVVLGREEIVVGADGTVSVNKEVIDDIKVWRVLFPIRTGKGFNGFYGYADFLLTTDKDGKEFFTGPITINEKTKTDEADEVKSYDGPFSAEDFTLDLKYEKSKEGGKDDFESIGGPSSTEGFELDIKYKKNKADAADKVESFEGPFSAKDFETAMEIAEDKSLLILVDLNQFYKKNDKELNGKELLKEIRKGAEGSAATLPDIKDTVEKCMLKRVESKYATLIPEKTYAGWKGDRGRGTRGAEEGSRPETG